MGIVRAQRELANWALAHRSDLTFALFDPRTMDYRTVSARVAEAFIAGQASLNAWGLPDPTGARRRRSAWLPGWLYSAVQPRRTVLRLLERVRLTAPRPGLSRLAERLQRPLITRRHRAPMFDAHGARRDFLPADMVFGGPIGLSAGDTLFCAGFGWSHSNISAIAQAKASAGFRLVVLCYDIIPIVRPDFFRPGDVRDVRRYWKGAFGSADLLIVNSRAVADDIGCFARAEGLRQPPLAVRPLGSTPATLNAGPNDALPAGLRAQRYALFVSTIEPRKGHEMLYRVWLRLLEAGIPQTLDFKLVFVGRTGWMTEALERQIRTDARVAGSLILVGGVTDGELDLLYRGAAFCVYPSVMEGFGLPVVEAFSRGKAVLVSAGGALAEVAKDLSPALPADDGEAWCEAFKRWMGDPALRHAYESAIRERFRHPSWDEACASVFDAIDASETEPAAA